MAERGMLLGFDLGSGSARCFLLDPECPEAPIVTARPWPEAAEAGTELDLEAIWSVLCETAREALARAGEGTRVLGLAASSFRFATVVLDAAGAPLLAVDNRDARAAVQSMQLAAEHGEALHRRAGHWPLPIHGVARLCWLRDEAPDLLARATHVLALSDWVAFRACGERATDPSQAGATGLLDLERGDYARDLIDALSLPSGILAEVRPAGSRLGRLTPEAARELGVEPGIPVGVGGGDTQCGLLGVAAISAECAAAICGTTVPVQRCVAAAPYDEAVWVEPHLVPGLNVVESNGGPAGECLDWIGRVLFPHAPVPAARVLAEAASAELGAGGMLSTFGAQVMNARALSLPVGDLTLSHMLTRAGEGRARLCRAIVEGMAYAVHANLAQTDPHGSVEALRVGGGMARSAMWAQLLSDVSGRPVLRDRTGESTGRGAALCAGVAAGVWADFDSAARASVGLARSEPDAESRAAHAPIQERWRELVAARAARADGIVQGHAIQALLRGAGPKRGAGGRFRPRVLVTAQLDPEALAAFEAWGEVRYESYREVGRLLQGDGLVEALAGMDVLVTEIDLVDAVSLGRLPRLKVVATCRGDAVNVDVEACTHLGIPVVHAPGRNADAVADLTLAFLLALARKLPQANAFLRDPSVEAGNMGSMGKAYGTLRGRELWGKTVGLVGLGAVGRKVAARLLPFEARILVHDPWIGDEAIVRAGAEPASFEALLAQSDFVSLHAAVTEASRGLLDRAAFARMKEGAALVNTARAALLDESALTEAIDSGHLAGAALDVFSVEPPGADHPLLAHDQVIATPHIGGNTAEVGAHQGRIVGADLRALLAGDAPRACLNREVLERFDWRVPDRPAPDATLAAWLEDRPPPAVTDLKRDEKKVPGAKAPSALVRPASAPEATVRTMEAILGRFLESAAIDPAFARAAEGQDVTLHFQATDLGIDWYLRLRDGVASGAVGAPDRAEVQLRMRAVVLDGMLAGTLNPAQEAMSGGIAFSGDATKAMTIQELQSDLQRVYLAARDAVGDPGDLAAIPDPGADSAS